MNKNIKKVIPFMLFATLLAGCTSDLTVANGDKTIAGVKEGATAKYELDLKTYQEIFDELFETEGAATVANEIVYRIAKSVVESSTNNLLGEAGTFKVAGATISNKRLAERITEKFDQYYTSTYKSNGLFNERLLVNSLRNSGYNIVVGPEGYYEETIDSLLGHDDLATKLKCDYSALINEKLIKDIYTELLKEEYIFTKHIKTDGTVTNILQSTDRYDDDDYSAYSKTKYVEYFSYTPGKASEASEINDQLVAKLEDLINTLPTGTTKVSKDAFETLVNDEFESIIEAYELEKLAEDFATINYKAAKNEYAVGTYEDNFKGEYLDIYDETEKAKLTADEISEAKTAISTYSGNGSYSIYHGYDLKKIETMNKTYYKDLVVSSKSSSIINTSIDSKLKLSNSDLPLTENGFLDYYNNGNPLFKLDGTYYIVRVEPIYNYKYVSGSGDDIVKESSSAEAILDAVELLATHSSYTSNTVKYYLDLFHKEGKLAIHNEEVYEYLHSTYSFTIK